MLAEVSGHKLKDLLGNVHHQDEMAAHHVNILPSWRKLRNAEKSRNKYAYKILRQSFDHVAWDNHHY